MTYYRDMHGNIIGSIADFPSCQYIYDPHGNLMATYHKNTDLTISVGGGEQVKGNQLMRFLKK